MTASISVIEQMQNGAFDFNDPKIRTAFALNLCTVSVSQIIDYDDVMILEQEYESILNNLNIEMMPKDEALLKILKQLLDTITFFRIQEGDKQFVDREYQNKMKNAIWNAVPNFGMLIAGGNPVTMAVSLASQIGIGYMNYRKAKAENALAHDKEMWQLHRAAIEQFNGLRRELFDTAWRLVDAHQLPDEYRLTERQVKQYNEILMDSDVYRRFERLDTIKENFIAYPPFWYFFGNTANTIARSTEGVVAEYYFQTAKTCFEFFVQSFSACNLLRENQIASSCALEYIDLLNPSIETEREKIKKLTQFAVKMSGNANDVLQLCAFAYLRVDDRKNAASLFRRLVNEDYNKVVNAQLLSGYYAGMYLAGDNTAEVGYKYLEERVAGDYLFPLPDRALIGVEGAETIENIQNDFVEKQKEILIKKFGIVIDKFQEKNRIAFNRCVPVPEGKEYTDVYYDDSVGAYGARKEKAYELRNKRVLGQYISDLVECDYPYNYLLVLNDMLNDITFLNSVHGKEKSLVGALSDAVINNREKLTKIRERIEESGKFDIETYQEILEIKFDDFTEKFFATLVDCSSQYIAAKTDIVSMNEAEVNLREFCIQQGFDVPDVLYETDNDVVEVKAQKKQYLSIDLIEKGITTEVIDDHFEKVLSIVRQYGGALSNIQEQCCVLFAGEQEFERYFIRTEIPNKKEISRMTVAVLDDQTSKDNDLIITTEGIMQIIRGKIKKSVPFDDIEIAADRKSISLHQTYSNEAVNMDDLINMVLALRTKPFVEVKEKKSAMELLASIIKKS